MKTRAIEVFIWNGWDFETWYTDYVEIPIDTPESKIEEVSKEELRLSGISYAICGVYCIPSLNDQPSE